MAIDHRMHPDIDSLKLHDNTTQRLQCVNICVYEAVVGAIRDTERTP